MNAAQFGERVRYYRLLRGWDQDALAMRISKSVPTISRIEGGTQNVTLEAILALANALEIPASALFVGADGLARRPDIQLFSNRCEKVVDTLHVALEEASHLMETARTLCY